MHISNTNPQKKINSIDRSGLITKIWQHNDYEHIIRDQKELERIRDYIESNPGRWADDDAMKIPIWFKGIIPSL